MFKSVKTHFTALNIGLVLFSSLILGSIAYFLILGALEKNQKDNLVYIAEREADHLVSMIKGKQDLLKQIAVGDSVQRFSQSFQDKLLQEYFTQFHNEFPILCFVNQQGIEELKVINGISYLDLKDIKGSQIYEDITWKPNHVSTSLTKPDDQSGKSFLEFGYYHENFFGDFRGIVIGRVPLDKILNYFSEFKLGDTGFLMILDKNGNILSHPDKDIIFQPVSIEGIDYEQILTNAVNMQSGVAMANIQGIDGFVAFSPVMDREWTMLAVLPYSEFIALPHQLRNIFLVVLGFVLILGILMSYISAGAITKPVLELSSFSKKIAVGDLTRRVSIDTDNEIGQLAKSFNIMAANLQHSKNELEKEAKIRDGLINELEFKNEELERFSYTVSHDLKSPLVTVKSFIGLLREDIKAGKSELIDKDLAQISSAADKMGSLLNDLLELSRIGRIAGEPQIIPLSELFDEVLTLIQGQIKQTNANIHIQPDMPSVSADRHHMFEVAQNLIDNALKFTREGSKPDISVTATMDEEFVTCCVADKGIGIDPKFQDKIFGLFDRLDPSFEGNGVGLALVKRIIEVHNGTITVKSKGNGHGSEFYFTLPVAHQEA